MKKLEDLISLSGKTALITGAANGIGAAIAARFAEAGAHLLLVDQDKKNLKKVKQQLAIFEVPIKTFKLDLSLKKEIDDFWVKIENIDVDILINNAGIYPFIDFLELSEKKFNQVMHLNLYAVMWMCQHFIRKRMTRGGTIVNIGSIEAIMPFKKDLTHYSLSKMGVLTLTRDLAREYAGKNFKVNAILPGGILTKGTKGAAKKALKRLEFGKIIDGFNFKQRLPVGRLGKPDEVAKMALVLSSELSSYVHGVLLPVDGGFLSA